MKHFLVWTSSSMLLLSRRNSWFTAQKFLQGGGWILPDFIVPFQHLFAVLLRRCHRSNLACCPATVLRASFQSFQFSGIWCHDLFVQNRLAHKSSLYPRCMINDLDTWKESLRNQSTKELLHYSNLQLPQRYNQHEPQAKKPPKNTKFLPGTFQEHATAIIRVQLEGVASRLRPCNHLIFRSNISKYFKQHKPHDVPHKDHK